MLPKDELFVDTGVNTGWAYFNGTVIPKTGYVSHKLYLKKTRENYIRFTRGYFEELLTDLRPIHVYLEEPEYWSNSNKSQAAVRTGSILHLMTCVITYANVCVNNNIQFTLEKPREWKGNLSKEATIHRIKLISNQFYSNEHVSDAVAFGLSKDPDLWHLIRKVKSYEKPISVT